MDDLNSSALILIIISSCLIIDFRWEPGIRINNSVLVLQCVKKNEIAVENEMDPAAMQTVQTLSSNRLS